MKRCLLLIPKYILNIIVIFALAYFLWTNRDSLVHIKRISFTTILIISVIEIFFSVINAVINFKIIKRISDKRIPFLDILLLQFVNNFFNKIAPKAGAAYRAYYLKKIYSFPYSKFASTIAGLYVISFLTYSLAGLATSFLIYFKYRVFDWFIILGFLSVLLFNLFLIIINPVIKNPKSKFLKIIKNILDGWNLIKKDKKFIFYLVSLTLLMIILAATELKIIYEGLGYNVSLVRVIFLSSIALFTTIANITPDGLGINELIYGYSNSVLAVPASILVLGSLILRGVRLIVSFILGGLSYFLLNINKEKNHI